MTRYEAYLTLFYALSSEAAREDGNRDLEDFVKRMNPFTSYREGSEDPEVYQRFCDKWISIGSTTTSNSQNGGFTFAKAFISSLPKKGGRYDDVKRAFLFVGQKEWDEALFLQAFSGTYELLYALLKKIASPDRELSSYLSDMDPFSPGFQAGDHPVWQRFCKAVGNMNIDGADREAAFAFVQSENRDFLFRAFSSIRSSEWDALRFESPFSFRMKKS